MHILTAGNVRSQLKFETSTYLLRISERTCLPLFQIRESETNHCGRAVGNLVASFQSNSRKHCDVLPVIRETKYSGRMSGKPMSFVRAKNPIFKVTVTTQKIPIIRLK